MKVSLLLIVISLASFSFGQDKQRRIGEIDFYGYTGFDVARLRAALPLHEGDLFRESSEGLNELREAIRQATGQYPTDLAPVCCDEQGGLMIFIGLAGRSITGSQHNPPPQGRVKLPKSILDLYDEAMEASYIAVRKRAGEDHSKGYGLSTDPTLRTKQLAVREYAVHHESRLRRVLASSRDAGQRIAAAHFLGYARQSKKQISALVGASRDEDETVRNNAVRALGVLAESNPKVAGWIPAVEFIAMLNSGSWTDRNKGGFLLDVLTKSRDPKLLSQLRSQALESLIEMARWKSTGHAGFARTLLGRIAGIEESRLQQLVQGGQVDPIIDALLARP